MYKNQILKECIGVSLSIMWKYGMKFCECIIYRCRILTGPPEDNYQLLFIPNKSAVKGRIFISKKIYKKQNIRKK